MLLLESLLFSGLSSGGISGVLPGSSRLIWGLNEIHVILKLRVESSSLDMNSVNIVGVSRSLVSSWHEVLNLLGWSIFLILSGLVRSFWLTSGNGSEKGAKDGVFHY
jgi:hypothetical protein